MVYIGCFRSPTRSVRLVASGMSKVKVAKELKMGEATVYRILRSTNQNNE
jgi:transposase